MRLSGQALVALLVAAVLGSSWSARAFDWGETDAADTVRIDDALFVLSQLPTGRELLGRAKKSWDLITERELAARFVIGDVSRTDAVLTRHYSPESGREIRERKVTISIKRGQSLEELVLDVAHELTHATHEPAWDPYDPDLTAAGYIQASLEAGGGEVDALISECKIAGELETHFGHSARSSPSYERCKRYRSKSKGVDRARVIADFYRVGPWKSALVQRLGKEARRFGQLSAASPQLYSSTGQAPYPVALLREYDEITDLACRNSRRRISQSGAQSRVHDPGRALATEAKRLVARRCR